MNKDFEIEYKNYAADNLPDLWSRIEAGIDEIEANNTADAKAVSDIPVTESNSTDTKEKKIVKFNIKRYSGLIAAAACLLIAIPAIIMVSKSSSKNANSAECAVAPSYDYSSAAETEAEADTYCDEAADYSYSEDASAEAVNEECEVATKDSNFSMESDAASNEVYPVTVMLCTNPDIENYSDKVFIESENATDSYQIATGEAVKDFNIININDDSVLYHLDELNVDDTVYAYLELSDVEVKYAICYTTDNNNTVKLALCKYPGEDTIILQNIQ